MISERAQLRTGRTSSGDASMDDLPLDVRQSYIALRILPDGRVAGVRRLMFHFTLHVGITEWGYDDRYCYGCALDAHADLATWSGEGDPPGRWHKHPPSGRRRDPDTGETWDERRQGPALGQAEAVRT